MWEEEVASCRRVKDDLQCLHKSPRPLKKQTLHYISTLSGCRAAVVVFSFTVNTEQRLARSPGRILCKWQRTAAVFVINHQNTITEHFWWTRVIIIMIYENKRDVFFLAAKDDRTVVVLFFSQVLLRVKENEIEYLHKEISCLRNELQFLNAVHIYIYTYVCVCVCLKCVCISVVFPGWITGNVNPHILEQSLC